MKIIASIDFKLNDTFYNKGDEVKLNTKEQIIKLQERGFIEPVSQKDLQNFGKEVKTETKPRFGIKTKEE